MTSPPSFKTKTARTYEARRDALQPTFPSAYAFLVAIDELAKGGRFHLGTDQNLHLYDREDFLCYVRIATDRAGPTLVMSPQPNMGQIKSGTRTTEAGGFVRQCRQNVAKLSGFHHWAKAPDEELVLLSNTPKDFFDAVLHDLKAR